MNLASCDEKLIEKPENLIAKDKMILILSDMAIVNSAKTTNVSALRENNFEPTQFIFAKYGIDSLQFVESDRYYASKTNEYLEIFTAVESKLEKQKIELEDAKKLSDSLRQLEVGAKKTSVVKK